MAGAATVHNERVRHPLTRHRPVALRRADRGCRLRGSRLQRRQLEAAAHEGGSSSSGRRVAVALVDGHGARRREADRPGQRAGVRGHRDVIFEPPRASGTVLQLTVKSVQQGSLADFKGFILDDTYKQKATYYYATRAGEERRRGRRRRRAGAAVGRERVEHAAARR